MARQTFTTGDPRDSRLITIIIEDYISFNFRENSEFYWIEKDDWKSKGDFWPDHMDEKPWFTPQMKKFIIENI